MGPARPAVAVGLDDRGQVVPLPLDGVRVVDFSQFLAGPYCTMQLADYGADVVKIERPGTGDDSRAMGPQSGAESFPFQQPNRNKRSLAVDLRSAEGVRIVRDLIDRADVVVENFRPGVTARLGVDYDSVAASNPGLIYCSISGFGQTGPISRRPGFDIIAQGMAGFLRMTGAPDGQPAKMGVAVTDLAAGLNAALAITMAYVHRLRGGEGQYIDVSLLDAGIGLTVWEAGAYFGAGEDAIATGSRHRKIAPYQAFATQDGYVTIGANNQKLWEILCRDVLQRPDLIERPEYAASADRIARVDQLEDELSAILREQPTDYWVPRLDAAGVPGGPVLTYAEAMAQPQVAQRAMATSVVHPVMGEIQVLGPVAKLSATTPTVRTAGPLLGEHTDDVLAELGYSAADIAALRAGGVVDG